MTRRVKIALASCGIMLSLVVAVVSGWAAFEYASGRDPFAFASSALVTTAEAGEGGSYGNEGGEGGTRDKGNGDADDSSGRASAGPPADGASTGSEASSGDVAAAGSRDGRSIPRGSSDAQGASDGVASSHATSDAPSPADDVGHAGVGEGQNGDVPGTSTPDDAGISVTVTVDASPAGGGAYTRAVSLPVGATAYDALVATGAAVNARPTAFGTYVAAIDGVAEKEHGGMSGWVYAVGGAEPNTSASNYVLSDGDVMVWTYVNVEY